MHIERIHVKQWVRVALAIFAVFMNNFCIVCTFISVFYFYNPRKQTNPKQQNTVYKHFFLNKVASLKGMQKTRQNKPTQITGAKLEQARVPSRMKRGLWMLSSLQGRACVYRDNK